MQINILRLDETEYWREDIRAKAGQIFGVYLYNPGIGVHCCELTPSYELRYMGAVIGEGGSIFGQMEDDAATEAAREDFVEELRQGIADNEDVTYMHCATVERFSELAHRGQIAVGRAVFGDFDGDEGGADACTPEEAMEAAMEYLRGNGFTDT